MKKYHMLVLAGILALSAQSGMAAVKAGEMSVSPMIGGFVFDNKQKVDRNAFVGGIRAGYNFTERIGIEGLFDYADTQTRTAYGSKDANMYRYGAEAIYNIFPNEKLVPHVAAGAGVMNLEGEGLNSKAKTMLDWGVGAKYFLTDNIALRGDVRHIITKDSRWKNNLEYMVGAYIPFGGVKKAAKPVEPPPAPAPVAKPVPAPAPAPAPVAKPVEPPPAPAPVAAPAPAPAPVEVAQPKASAVAERFCNKPSVLKVQFATGKSTINSKYSDDLKHIGDFLKEFPNSKGEISGHTDNVGGKAMNNKLSQSRAESVKKYLVDKFGVAADRISAKGYGFSKPVASNKTAKGKAENRRIEANFSCE